MPSNENDDVWVHDLDPYAVELWEGGPIRWYGLAYLAGFVLAFLLIRRVLRRGASPLPPAAAGDLLVALAIGAVVGGRLGYVAFYQPSLLWTVDRAFPFWKALAIHEGGMASHGGMIGVVLAALYVARRRRAPFLHVVDLAAFGAPLGLMLGRLANFVNSELYGRPAPPSLPWAVKFPSELHTWSAEHVAALHRDLAHAIEPSLAERIASQGFTTAAIDAVQRGDDVFTRALAPHLVARHPSQVYEALLEGAFVFMVLLFAWRRPRTPGTIAGLFAISYAAVRIVGEQFRLPDAHIAAFEFAQLGVTRGQVLSAVLLVAGCLVAIVAARRPAPALGGWRQPARE